MNLNVLLADKNMTKYRLSKITNIPYSTLNDIFSMKTDILNCSVSTVHKIAQALGVSIDTLINDDHLIDYSLRSDFETFKSNIKHAIKENSPDNFIDLIHQKNVIRIYYEKKYFAESLYLLATIDYLSRINSIPLIDEYNDIRKFKLQDRLYPASVVIMANVDINSDILEITYRNSIKEFKQFNIVESEIDNIA
jgi:DNA-binding Xre family transcriptional regulator